MGSRGKAPGGGPSADALMFFNAETEFQRKLTCTINVDDDHLRMKTMVRPE